MKKHLRREPTGRAGINPGRRAFGRASVALAISASTGNLLWAGTARAASEAGRGAPIRIGLLLDMSSLYSDVTGQGSLTAARMAVEDFGGKVLGRPIEVLYADHLNKADVASAKAREWFDTQNLDMIGDVSGSGAALAAVEIAKAKNKIIVMSGPGASQLTNENCTPVSVHYAWDTHALANGTVRGVLKEGGDTWFFLSADYAFGKALEKDATEVIVEQGGRVVGSASHPLNTADFSSFILQAQASKAKVVALANAGGDTVNAIKTAFEFGLPKTQRIAGLLVFINDIHALGLPTTKGMLLTESFYWDMNDATRAWSRRYFDIMKKMPNMAQAGVYSSTLHYLKAVKAAGTSETGPVMEKFRSIRINDMYVKDGWIRQDGRMMREMYVFEVKDPSESKYPWDYYRLKVTIPAEQAFLPLSRSRCPLVKV
jgi:branched-chain amino acid transport system substrate-binding protein